VPLDPEKLAEILITAAGVLFVGSSTVLIAIAVAWRLTLKPTLRAFLEYRTARAEADPVLSRRVKELEEELRAVKNRMGALPEGTSERLLGSDVPWRGTKEKA
jgi:hypothetical protein